ncbi:MAG: C-terminal helicase domain-containing protein, partial [Ruminococcus sp.]
NIQSASVVMLCEPQFKPSIENQAISRAYRMGQSRNVLVYRLLCEDTVDEKIMDMLKEKQAVFDAFADKSTIAEETLVLD